jgi:hypothetical protein
MGNGSESACDYEYQCERSEDHEVAMILSR